MVYVPAGEFEMGSTDAEVDDAMQLCDEYHGGCDRGWFEDEQPAHAVELDGFWIDQTEVTNAQYALCVADGDCEESGYADDGDYNGDDYPVVGVDWYNAAAYCQWAGARLPTEAEWEYAARGPQGHTFPWGKDAPTCQLAQCGACSGRTVPVGSLPDGASWCEALDMAGNVWEWVADWYGDYPSGRQVNPTGPSSGADRVLRGGSWVWNPNYVRGAHRREGTPGYGHSDRGFRCARGSQ
jgi:formylglycine-generating enzyme required for sulfatase activity